MFWTPVKVKRIEKLHYLFYKVYENRPNFLTYQMIDGYKHTWLYAVDVPNRGDYVFTPITEKLKINSFRLVSGKVFRHAAKRVSAQVFLEDTGIDLRNQHLNFGVVSTKRLLNSPDAKYIVHLDTEPKVSSVNRTQYLAEKLAFHRSSVLYYYTRHMYGSINGWVHLI